MSEAAVDAKWSHLRPFNCSLSIHINAKLNRSQMDFTPIPQSDDQVLRFWGFKILGLSNFKRDGNWASP